MKFHIESQRFPLRRVRRSITTIFYAICLFIILAPLVLTPQQAVADQSSADKQLNASPNIIVFFSDQQRWDSVGCYGQKLPVTPNLDRMAADGTRFEFAFTCQPVCGPARSVMQTGKYATETGCFRNNIALPQSERTLAHMLSDAGYEVGYIGKWHLASTGYNGVNENFRELPVPPERRGGYKDFWLAADVMEFTTHSYDGHLFNGDMEKIEFPEGRYRVDAETDFAIDYLRTRDGKKPFFLFLSYIEPHHQNGHNQFEGPTGSEQRWGDYEAPADLVGTRGDWKKSYPNYLGCINALDGAMGRLRAELDQLDIADNTVILFTSDHGCHFRTRNSEYKRSCHDNSIRVPMIACGPGFEGGRTVDELVSLIDVAPTVVAAANVTPPETMRGRPLQPLAAGEATDWPEEVFVQVSESEVGRAIRTKRWKYGVTASGPGVARPGSDIYTESALYDLENDPHERTNLVAAPDFDLVRKQLSDTLKRRMREAGETVPAIVPAN